MKQILLLFILVLPFNVSKAFVGRALIYNGTGTCKEDCATIIGQILLRYGFQISFVNENTFKPEYLNYTDLWVQPGGDSIEMSRALSPEAKVALRNYVLNGGRYMGFCAGAYLAAEWIDQSGGISGLGLVNGEFQDYQPRYAQVLPIQWGKRNTYLYFEDGPFLDPFINYQMEPMAYYPTGDLAATGYRIGLGQTFLSGVHPEAPEYWKSVDGLTDPDGDDYYLFANILQWFGFHLK